MRRYLIPLVFLLLLAGGAVITGGEDEDKQPAGGSVTVEVDRVVDGDTAKVFYEGDSEYVRYIGIDTPVLWG